MQGKADKIVGIVDIDGKQVRDLSLHTLFREGGTDSQRVAVLHGNGFCAATLLPLAEALPADWHLWLVDLPGHGQSSMPLTSGMPDWQGIADTVASTLQRWADTDEHGPLLGIGHSFGGVLMLLAALQTPELFSQIILLDPPLFTPSIVAVIAATRATGTWGYLPLSKKAAARRSRWPSKEAMRESLAQRKLYRDWHPDALNGFVESGSLDAPDGGRTLACDPNWEAQIFSSYPRRLWARLPGLEVPTTILNAFDSDVFFARNGAIKAASLSPLIVREDFGQGHCFPMSDPSATAERIVELAGATSRIAQTPHVA